MAAKKPFHEFSGGWRCICSKGDCEERMAASVRELKKEYPEYKNLLNSFSTFICSSCWGKDIIGRAEASKSVKSCSQCSKNFKSGDSFYSLTYEGRKLAFCSKSCAGKYGENEKDKERKKRESYAETARKWKETQLAADTKQLVESLSADMEAGKDISHYDWESANWLNEDQKEICRKYVKNRQEYDDLKNQRDNLEQEQVNDNSSSNDSSNNNDQETCAKCGSSGVKYEHKSNSDGKKFCSQDCFVSYYQPSNSSPNNSPSSPTSNDIPQEIPSNSPSNNSPSPNNSPNNPSPKSNAPLPTVSFSDSNSTQDKNFQQTLEKIKDSNGKAVIFPFQISPKQRIFLEVIQDAKLGKYSGDRELDYDKLKLSEREKGQLEKLIRKMGIEINSSRVLGGVPTQMNSPGRKTLIAGIIIIGVVAFISLAFILRKRRHLKKKKTR